MLKITSGRGNLTTSIGKAHGKSAAQAPHCSRRVERVSAVKLPVFSSVAAGRFEVDRVPQRLGGNQILKSSSFEGQAT